MIHSFVVDDRVEATEYTRRTGTSLGRGIVTALIGSSHVAVVWNGASCSPKMHVSWLTRVAPLTMLAEQAD